MKRLEISNGFRYKIFHEVLLENQRKLGWVGPWSTPLFLCGEMYNCPVIAPNCIIYNACIMLISLAFYLYIFCSTVNFWLNRCNDMFSLALISFIRTKKNHKWVHTNNIHESHFLYQLANWDKHEKIVEKRTLTIYINLDIVTQRLGFLLAVRDETASR